MTTSELPVTVAVPTDVPEIVALVRSAYRGDSSRSGWTTEADLLDDLRTDEPAVARIVAGPGSAMLLLRDGEGTLIACCQLERRGADGAYFGMFAVSPLRQNAGLGRVVLAAAEAFARDTWGATSMEMTVIDVRRELIDWYVRRGYTLTAERRPFVSPAEFQFAVLRKALG